jgi:hypothetical protein
MKTIVIFLVIASFFGCEKNPISPDSQDGGDFTAWSNSLTLADVKAMYNSGVSFMSDVRTLPSILPFSYKDSIVSGSVVDTSVHYPYSTSEGTTSVRYKDSFIFQNSWNSYYMDGVRSITTVKYGESYGTKLLRITNESHFPPNPDWPNGYYGRENRLFIESNNILKDIDLRSYGVSYALGEIKGSSRNGVIILYSFDFVRSEPKYQYLILLDLSSKKSKMFRFDYN